MKLLKLQYFTHLIMIGVIIICSSCKEINKENKKEGNETSMIKKGSFGYDVNFLKQYYKNAIVLSTGEAKLIVIPELQGRVMTSTAAGEKGQSFGWINHALIASGKIDEHFNPLGGEERFWLGPEGGQFSIYFKPESAFVFENWYVPKELDTEPFNVLSKTIQEVHFQKEMKLLNYSNTVFSINVDRSVRILSHSRIKDVLGMEIPLDIAIVGYETENTITNIGENPWDDTTGMPSIWILSMLKHSDQTTVVVPFKIGKESELGKIVTDDYFGKVPDNRLIIRDSVLFFKADGKKRSKIGLSPKRALPYIGSYDPIGKVLTIAQFSLPQNNSEYVNSLWEIQKNPFNGDAVNAYNDGPMGDGSQLGPFYELESSSPAAKLSPNEKLTHIHRTFHFKGKPEKLEMLARKLLHFSLNEISNIF